MEWLALTVKNPEITVHLGMDQQYFRVIDCTGSGGDDVHISRSGVDLDAVVASLEKNYNSKALKLTQGNEARAAKLLNIKYSTLRYHRRKYQIL